MTTRTHLPYDVARCAGKTSQGKLVKPCTTCAREQFRHIVNPFMQNWIEGNPSMGYCPQFIDMEYSDD